jgi:hypothetical protein
LDIGIAARWNREEKRLHRRPFSFEETTLCTLRGPSLAASSEAVLDPRLILFAEIV